MGQIGSMIADAGSVGLRYARRLLESIPEDRFARTAAPAGVQVVANHPAFNIGHLTLYPVKIVELLGQDTIAASAPAQFVALFSKDQQCQDDPDGTIYPSKSAIVELFYRTYEAAFQALRNSEDQVLLAPNPVESPLKHLCPTVGAMLTFYAIGHVTSHLGQISTWRRMEGMPGV